jgi:hypothetical protein
VKKFLAFSVICAALIFGQVYAGNQGKVIHLENTAVSTASDSSPLQLSLWASHLAGANSVTVVGYDSLAYSDDNYITIHWINGDTAKISIPLGTVPTSMVFNSASLFDSVQAVRADTSVSLSVHMWYDKSRR